jgi:aquaporin Z
MQSVPLERAALPAARMDPSVLAIDGALLATFMVSACCSVVLLEHPSSPLPRLVTSAFVRRALTGLAMGLTAAALIYSPWGKRSGALMNPALTLCFVRLGKLGPLAGAGYIAAQFAGGGLGVLLSALAFGPALAHPAVNYVITAPGAHGAVAAWLSEFVIALLMVSAVLSLNRDPRLSRYTGLAAAALVALFITFEAPLSGMSLNPARSFGSSLVGGSFQGFWIYATAPVLGMLAGVELQRALFGRGTALCGKLQHAPSSFVECNCPSTTRSKA